MYLCLRYYTSDARQPRERVRELESKLLERLYETFGAMKLVKSFARETARGWARLPGGPADKTMNARIAITWQAVAVLGLSSAPLRFLGTALVVIVGGGFVMRGTA